jgi:hypothetical protein
LKNCVERAVLYFFCFHEVESFINTILC